MADVNISKYRASVVRDGSKPASPGFVVSEGQDPVNPPGTNNFVPYTGATANVELGEFGVEAGFVTLDTTPTNIPTDQGAIYWDDTRSTAALIMNGTLQHIGQDSFFYVKNSSGSTIPKGTCVGFAGTDGGSGHLLVTPFLANGSVPSSYFMGVTAEAIANGSFGQVMHFGELEGINTSGFTAGALLYASSTVAGAFQTTAPVAPNNIILVAAAVNSKNNGAIVVRPTYGSNINTDEGVKITSPTTGDLLQLQAGGLWENKTLAQVIGSAYVPSTRTITINGTTQDLSANRTFNVGTVTSVGLSSATSGVTIGSTPVTSSGTITLAIATASGSQNGLLSSTDWTTFNNKQNALTNPVTGTGTTNRLAKFTGASTIGNSNISDGGVTIFNENPTAGQFAWQFNGNTTTGQSFGASVVAGTNSSDIAFRVLNASASTTHLLVKGDGNLIVGGTTDNGSRLQVSGTAYFSSNVRINGNDLDLNNGSVLHRITNDNTNLLIRADYGNDSPNSTIQFSIDGTTRMLLNSSGSVGIGTSSPTNGLLVINSTASNGVRFALESSGTMNGIVALGSNAISGLSTTDLALWTRGVMAFETGASGEKMRITSSGNLLVGTTSDNGARLQVSGTATISSTLTAGADVNLQSNESYVNLFSSYVVGLNSRARFRAVGAGGGSGYGGDFRLDTRATNNAWNTDVFVVNSSGNVGIGTASPAVKLNIVDTNPLVVGDSTGSLAVTYETGTTAIGQGGGIFLGIPASSGSFFSTYIKSARESADGANSAAALVFGTRVNGGSNTERMRITSSGNVGIGTSSPTFRLDVQNNTQAIARVLDTSTNASLIMQAGSGSAMKVTAYNYASSTALPLYIQVDGANTIMQAGGGNVLIGTTTDNGAKLNVVGNLNAGGTGVNTDFRLYRTVAPSVFFSINAPGGSPNTSILGVNGTDVLALTATGNVGIGTTSPSGRLTVSSDQSSNNQHINILGTQSGFSQEYTIGIPTSTKDLRIYDLTANVERMRITSGGNVLIGTTTDAGARLYLTGGLVSTMLSLRSNNGLSTNINFTSESPGGGSDNYTINHTIVHGSGGGYRIEHNVTSRWIRMIAGTGGVELSGGATSWSSISDIRVKNIIGKIENSLDAIKSLNAIKYTLKTDLTNKKRVGLIAQEVEKVLPECVEVDEKGMLSVRYTELIPMIVESIKELNEKIK